MNLTTDYSHAFFVGLFNGEVTPAKLQCSGWTHMVVNDAEYNEYCSEYYQGHVDAVFEKNTGNSEKPEFLRAVSHYVLPFSNEESKGKHVTLQLKKRDGKVIHYNFYLCNLHFYFFPLNIVFFVIEIDDSKNTLDDLTFAHLQLATWQIYEEKEPKSSDKSSSLENKEYVNQEFLSCFDPLKEFLSDENKNLRNLLKIGDKFKTFQTIQIRTESVKDNILYEIGSCSPIGCVGKNYHMTPSDDYYHMIMAENTASAFKDWKCLALMDSFTMLANAEQNWPVWYNRYFPLIYLRCLFEKTYCFSRNAAYLMEKNVKDISDEISKMEQFYFYDTISYKFLPNLLYKTIAKGLELKEERKELSEQIKERAKVAEAEEKEQEEKRSRILLSLISVFAIFSATWDAVSMLGDACPGINKEKAAYCGLVFALVISVVCVVFLASKKAFTLYKKISSFIYEK